MAIDWYIHTGNTQLTSHHLVLVPKDILGIAQMNDTETTKGAYIGSKMFKTHLPKFATKISTALDSHILTWRSLMSNDINTTATAAGYSGGRSGCSSDWAWTDTNCRLLSEVDVYGSSIYGNAWDVGESNRQLPGFAMNPELLVKLNPENNSRNLWWLCAVANSADFAFVTHDGGASSIGAQWDCGVVPKVLFG